MTNSNKVLREFGLIVGTIFIIIIGWIIPSINNHPFRSWTLFIGIPLILLALIAPRKLNFAYIKWLELGNLLSFVNSYIILGIIFLFIMFPMSLIMKILKYDPLKRSRNNYLSYKEIRNNDNIDLEKIF